MIVLGVFAIVAAPMMFGVRRARALTAVVAGNGSRIDLNV